MGKLVYTSDGEVELEEEVFDVLENHTSSLAETANEIAEIGSLKTNASNISRDTFFNGDPGTTGANTAWSDRQILLLGDSHGWGEGAPNWQGATTGKSYHAAWIHNKGFYGRLIDYLYQKFDSKPWRVIPIYDKNNPLIENSSTTPGAIALNAPNKEPITIKETFTKTPRIVSGKYYIAKSTKSIYSLQTTKDFMNIMCNAIAREDAYSDTEYKYNADIGLFSEASLFLAPDAEGKSNICFNMEEPSRYAIIQLRSGWNGFAKAKIELLDETIFDNDGTFNYDQVPTGFGNPIYGTATPSVLSFSGTSKTTIVAVPNAIVNSNNIIIDCGATGLNLNLECVYIVDFKQKKKGIIRLSHAGNSDSGATNNPILSSTVLVTRGVIFGNRDLIRNFSLGGHTVGAWIGEEASYWNETRDHIADALSYMSGALKGAVIEAPLVNERIKQTPIATFKTRLTTLKTKLNTSNIIIFTTLGEKNYEFEGATSTINYDDYANAVKEWATGQGGDVTFVDCRKYIKGLVSSGIVADYNDLYINSGHPSPLVNELFFEMLKKVVNMKF